MSASNGHRVFAILPRAGLANRLFIWGRAVVFARQHDLPTHTHGWGHWHIGPWIRGENSKRYYKPYFESNARPIQCMIDRIGSHFGYRQWVLNPLEWREPTDSTTFVFAGNPDKSDYFQYLRGDRRFVKDALRRAMKKTVRDTVEELPELDVAVHVRRGDFQHLGWQLGDDYYIEVMRQLADTAARPLRFAIFSDSSRSELSSILAVPGTEYMESRGDIIDLWAMSKASTIVTTLKSTFGYWAAFLSDADIITHPDHTYGLIADDGRFEGTIECYRPSREDIGHV